MMEGSDQEQNIDNIEASDSSVVQIAQAGRDAINAQNFQVNKIYTIFGSNRSSSKINWKWATECLLEQRRLIRERRKDTLLHDILLDLDMVDTPEQVMRSHPLESLRSLTSYEGNKEIIAAQRSLLDVYDRDDIQGRLLILGTPGAGKTTALLGLAEALVDRALAQPKTTIPIIFELSTWRDDTQSIENWLVERLCDEDGDNRRQKIYEKWIEERILVPLLDGLDELGFERQQLCTEKLYDFAANYPRVVICCRSRAFELANLRATSLKGAIQLQPLTDDQIIDYLRQVNKFGLWEQIQTVPEMRRMLDPIRDSLNLKQYEPGLFRIPLFISLAAQVYEPGNPLRNKSDLFERYINKQLYVERTDSFKEDVNALLMRKAERSRKQFKNRIWAFKKIEKEPSWRVTRYHISWLASQLQKRNQVEFLIEKIQPDYLRTNSLKLQYKLVFTLIVLIGSVASCAMRSIFVSGDPLQAALANFVSINTAVLTLILSTRKIFRTDEIKLVEKFHLSFSIKARREILNRVKLYSLIGSSLGVFTGLIGLRFGQQNGMFLGFCIGAILGITMGTSYGLVIGMIIGLQDDLKVRSNPNQGIWNSLQNVLWLNLSVLLVFIFVLFLLMSLVLLMAGMNVSVLMTFLPQMVGSLAPNMTMLLLNISLLVSFYFSGGIPCAQHLALRIIMSRHYSTPWNLARFLNYCTERRLLQRIGGRYRFIHRELLDHFATIPNRPN
jgi:hypothetical protein